jgi:hypothetical protein
MMRVRALVLIGATALVLGACGNDVEPKAESGSSAPTSEPGTAGADTTEPETTEPETTKPETTGAETTESGAPKDRNAKDQAFVDDVVKAIGSDSGETFPADQVECWVGDMVDGIGVERLNEAGFTVKSAAGDSEADADISKLSAADRALVGESFVKCVDLEAVFTESLAAGSGSEELPEGVTACLAGLDWDKIETGFAEAIVSGKEDDISEDDPLMAPLVGCMMQGLTPGATGPTGATG